MLEKIPKKRLILKKNRLISSISIIKLFEKIPILFG
jgi:hypothetical protein